MPTETVPALTLTPADVADLADALRPYHAIYGSFFSRSESRAWAERYLHGLLSPLGAEVGRAHRDRPIGLLGAKT